MALITLVACAGAVKPWMKVSDTPRERAEKLLAQMSTPEKITMVHGSQGGYTGQTPVNSRLGIPAILMEDGPQGFRGEGESQARTSTQWPSLLTVASAWDRQLMYSWAAAMGKEFADKGANVALGPGINVARVPVNGRNFEYISGEDPHLGAQLVGHYVRGIQSNHVIATAKHWVNNNQETDRGEQSAVVGKRTEWEIYFPPFEAAVRAGVGAYMCSYNKINGTYACENDYTLNQALKGKMKFEGFVMSDWGATHSTVQAANAGLDQEQPDSDYFGSKLEEAVKSGDVPAQRLDDMVLRILTPMFAVGLFDYPLNGSTKANVTSPEHNTLARRISAESTVLLKNEHVLPINASLVRNIAIIGDRCGIHPITGSDGSGSVTPAYQSNVFDGVLRRAPRNIRVQYAPSSPQEDAVRLAQGADLAVVCAGTRSTEGRDRDNLSLEDGDNSLISAVAANQKHTVVVLSVPGAILMPWADAAAAILVNFMPGQEAGNAVAEVLFGDVNPSARLPLTFPNKENEVEFTPEQYPGVDKVSTYSEGLLVGYRWYHAKNVKPAFPFGHGLSYTTFQYANAKAIVGSNGVNVTFTVRNNGSRDGSEVAQVYLTFPAAAGEPPKQLKAFEKIRVRVGETQSLNLFLDKRSLSVWDEAADDWTQVRGSFVAHIGASSADIRLTVPFDA